MSRKVLVPKNRLWLLVHWLLMLLSRGHWISHLRQARFWMFHRVQKMIPF